MTRCSGCKQEESRPEKMTGGGQAFHTCHQPSQWLADKTQQTWGYRPSIPVTSHHSGWQTRHSKHGGYRPSSREINAHTM